MDTPLKTSALDYAVRAIDGHEVALSRYAGKVVLIVNVASKCGFTGQYGGLQEIYEKYKDKGFVILGFPANNFMKQEPGTDAEIKTFCSLTYNVTFDMFSKISVRGKDIAPLYAFLTSKKANPEYGGSVKWNFTKFLLDRTGKVVGRFGSPTTPTADKVVKAIEKQLARKVD